MRRKKHNGYGVAQWLLAIPAAIIVAVVITVVFFEGRKAYWDSKVREFCRKEGGVTVYERVPLSVEEFRKLGGDHGPLPIPSESTASKDSPYISKQSRIDIREKDPEVIRGEWLIERRSDGKVLARLVYFSRIGGDNPLSFGHPTVFSCRNIPGFRSDIERQVFEITGATK